MASQRLTLGLVCRTLDVEPEALHTVKTLRLERLRLAALCPLDALAGSLRELYLRDNRLETLDCAEALAALAPHLAVLDLARNRLAEVRGLAALRGLRVLDLSANELARDPGADELPLASLTVLDLRGNPFGKTRVTAGPVLEELDGEAVVPRAGGGRSTVTAVGDAVRRPVARSECVVYVPLVGNRPGEAAKRTLALRFGRADDVARVARDFCAAHAVDGADAVRELTEICRAAAAAPPRLVGPDRGDAGAALGLEAQIEETGDALARCARGVDGALAGARATAAAAVEKRRAAARARAAAAAAAPTAAARADESARRRAAAAAEEAAARRAFAASVRARLPAAYESSPKAKRAPPSRLPEAPRDDEEFDRYTAAPAELDARPPDAYDAADDSSDDSYAAA
ncbi:unnamed protein product [Pelagomonas calceolata]|jgi:hypothetical protein|uniref:U2A'/phosphoprotein 32 family A C-terminal domain-containing protein n=1 Tax=Pelagomonas calceolata TaxID=35677 RepID=A0A8J2S4S3_9STRA|nr:unnamed protein product [Pelagomonas calceolata]